MASLGFSSTAHTTAAASHAPAFDSASGNEPSAFDGSSLEDATAAAVPPPGPYAPCLILHGGAGWISDERASVCVEGVKRAAEAGYEVLMKGGTAVDAVEAAVRAMEDDPQFNAGRGSVLTSAASVELDAVIVDGDTLASGAVACCKAPKNPVTLARSVMERTPHALVVGEGADAWAREQAALGCAAGAAGERKGGLGVVEVVGEDYFLTPTALERLKRMQKHEADAAAAASAAAAAGTTGATAAKSLEDDIHAVPVCSPPPVLAQAPPTTAGAALAQGSGGSVTVVTSYPDAESSAVDEAVLRDPGFATDTVGAVARDSWGRIAAATSTGGMTNKRPGRVGDAPILGAGVYSDSRVVGISTTGHGEAILRSTLAARAAVTLEMGADMPSIAEARRLQSQETRAPVFYGLVVDRPAEEGGEEGEASCLNGGVIPSARSGYAGHSLHPVAPRAIPPIPAPARACEAALSLALVRMQERVQGSEGAGAVAIDGEGRCGKVHNTPKMSWCAIETVTLPVFPGGVGSGARLGVITGGVEANKPLYLGQVDWE